MKEAYLYLKELLNDNDTVVVATSGGPDSMALFHLLLRVKEIKNINIICSHVNHNTGRIGQDEEEQYVKDVCEKNNIIFESMKIDSYDNLNFESEARDKRYNYFEKLINKYNAKYLFTAHHGDDLIETILMRIVRGSTLRGYSGFSKVVEKNNYKIVRPLIEVTKEEIIEYLKENNIKYYIDPTNLEDDHTRNRYRHYILPKLKEEDKNVHLKFYKFSRMMIEYDNYIKNETNKHMNIYHDNKLDLKKFNELEHIIKTNVIYNILEDIYQNDLSNIHSNHVELIMNLIDSNKANASINLPNIIVTKRYNILEFNSKVSKKEDYKFELNTINKLPNGYNIDMIDSIDSDSNYVCRIDTNEVKLPLYVRNRLDGDKIEIKNLNGSKKIKDIFINSKINIDDRNIWPIVIDSNDTIIWLPGLIKSKFDKTKDQKYDIILRYYKKEEENE